MSHIRFRVPLRCTNCGALNDERSSRLYTAGIGHDVGDMFADPGTVLGLEPADFEDGYFVLRRPASTETTVSALERWSCIVCHRVQFARVEFEYVDALHWRFVSAAVVSLSTSMLDEANYISRNLDEWAPNPGDDVARVRALERQLGLS